CSRYKCSLAPLWTSPPTPFRRRRLVARISYSAPFIRYDDRAPSGMTSQREKLRVPRNYCRVNVMIQFVSQVLPPSSENACSHRATSAAGRVQRKRITPCCLAHSLLRGTHRLSLHGPDILGESSRLRVPRKHVATAIEEH